MKAITENKKKLIAIFHEGRGGRFNNGGHKTFKDFGNFSAEHYGINIYFTFENEHLLPNDIGLDLLDMAYNWNNREKQDFEKLKLKDENGNIIKAVDLGDPVIVDDSREIICTVEEYNSDTCNFNIDNEYNTYYWLPVEDIDINSKEWKILIKEQWDSYEFQEFLESQNVDPKTLKFLTEVGNDENKADLIFDSFESVLRLMDYEECYQDDSEVEINGKHYLDTSEL